MWKKWSLPKNTQFYSGLVSKRGSRKINLSHLLKVEIRGNPRVEENSLLNWEPCSKNNVFITSLVKGREMILKLNIRHEGRIRAWEAGSNCNTLWLTLKLFIRTYDDIPRNTAEGEAFSLTQGPLTVTWHKSNGSKDDWVIASHIRIEESHEHKQKAELQRLWCAMYIVCVVISLKLKYAQDDTWGIHMFMVIVHTNARTWWVIDLRWWPTLRDGGGYRILEALEGNSVRGLHLKLGWRMCEGLAHYCSRFLWF